jgi:hypothetical protein
MDCISELQRLLRYEDIHAWRDTTNIPGGTEWAQVVEAALDRMDAMVVVLTPESARSERVEKECRAFIGHGKTVIPYIANAASTASLPEYLSSIQYIDGRLTEGFSILTKQLRAVLGL